MESDITDRDAEERMGDGADLDHTACEGLANMVALGKGVGSIDRGVQGMQPCSSAWRQCHPGKGLCHLLHKAATICTSA